MARPFTRPWAGAFAAAGLLAAGLMAAPPDTANAQASYEINPREPEYIYDRVCGYCHGHDIGPVLRGRELPPETIAYFVRHGAGAMPAFKPTEITDTELAALAQWISTSKADPKEHGK